LQRNSCTVIKENFPVGGSLGTLKRIGETKYAVMVAKIGSAVREGPWNPIG
jgi:hypothetical protein